jgi:hypothetical protein
MAKRYYEGPESKRDGGLLGNDSSAVAFLPQSIKYHAWPSSEKYLGEDIPANMDSISGVNAQMASDVRTAKRARSKSKY